MSPYFAADLSLFGIFWMVVTMLDMAKHAWRPPYSIHTFSVDYLYTDVLVGKLSLLRTTFADDFLRKILLFPPSLEFFLNLGGFAMAIIYLGMSRWLIVLTVFFAMTCFHESMRRLHAFAALISGSLRGTKMPVLKRYIRLYHTKTPYSYLSDLGKIFTAFQLLLWTS